MDLVVLFLIKCLIALILALALFCVWRTWQMEHSANQALFLKGTVPDPLPEGLYAGSVPGHTVSWLGKKFDAAQKSGINVFDAGGGKESEKYPFATSIGAGLRDTTLTVFKIDYDIPANPFWLRPILDEIVETSPGHFWGKLHVRIIPGYPFTLAYFELKR